VSRYAATIPGLEAATRWFLTGLDLFSTVLTAGEMTTAAGSVIGRRTALAGAALREPHRAELARMGPEKIAAFGEAGAAIAIEMWQIQRDMLAFAAAQAQAATRAVLTFGAAPTLLHAVDAQSSYVAGTLDRAAHETAAIAGRALNIGAIGVAPIHRKATANARRLAKRRGRGTSGR
jgi:hypothetical protein